MGEGYYSGTTSKENQMSAFVVTSASYNGSPPGQKDALVFVQGTVDGTRCVVNLWWSAIQTAFLAGGTAGVQQLIGYWFAKYASQYPKVFDNQPVFPVPTNIPTPIQGDINASDTTCEAAMVDSWTA
jgi:hypothetical protein